MEIVGVSLCGVITVGEHWVMIHTRVGFETQRERRLVVKHTNREREGWVVENTLGGRGGDMKAGTFETLTTEVDWE